MSGSEIKIFELNNTHHYHDDNFRFSLDKTKKIRFPEPIDMFHLKNMVIQENYRLDTSSTIFNVVMSGYSEFFGELSNSGHDATAYISNDVVSGPFSGNPRKDPRLFPEGITRGPDSNITGFAKIVRFNETVDEINKHPNIPDRIKKELIRLIFN